jgi:uncharacterized membrane protein (DUF2068 family)
METRTPEDSALGLRLIVAYKFARGSLFLVLALVVTGTALTGGAEWLHDLAVTLREHVTGMWSLKLADLLVRASTQRFLAIGAVALACDGGLSLFEGWALKRGFSWAPRLVVAVTASFLPWEVFELFRGIRAARVVVFLLNVAVLVYLARKRHDFGRQV